MRFLFHFLSLFNLDISFVSDKNINIERCPSGVSFTLLWWGMNPCYVYIPLHGSLYHLHNFMILYILRRLSLPALSANTSPVNSVRSHSLTVPNERPFRHNSSTSTFGDISLSSAGAVYFKSCPAPVTILPRSSFDDFSNRRSPSFINDEAGTGKICLSGFKRISLLINSTLYKLNLCRMGALYL